MKLSDLGNTFHAPKWLNDEISEAISIIQKEIPGIKVNFDYEDESGIVIGDDNGTEYGGSELVYIEKIYANKHGYEIDLPTNSNNQYLTILKENGDYRIKKYNGKLYQKYVVISQSNVLHGVFDDFKTASMVALAVYHAVVCTRREASLFVAQSTGKLFSLF